MKQIERIQMEKKAMAILDRLHTAGFKAYIVGGYVRDAAIGYHHEGNVDIDIATSAKPHEVMKLFVKTVPTGIQHGTVTVIIDQHSFEVTTFRKEGAYSDHRRPDEVQFISDLHVDLSRRDFTMNAMAMDRNGQIIDPFHGRDDLRRKRLRCVGNAKIRFSEDALRIVRAIRFAAHYELQIEKETWEAIIMERQRLKMIAIERIRVELERMMATNRVDYALTLLIRSELFSHINIASIFQQRLRTLTESDAKLFTMVKHSVLRWFTLSMLMNLSSSQCKQFFHSLTFPNKQIVQFVQLSQFDEQVRELLQHFATMRSNDSIVDFGAQWKLLSAEQGVEVAQCWLNWIISLFDKKHGLDALRYTNHRKQLEALVQHGLDWIDEMPIHSLGQLQVTGRDLLSLHKKGGPWVGHLLNELLDAVVSGKIPNEKKALMEFAKEKTGVIENE